MYSLEHTVIARVSFTPHHIGPCCTNIIPVHCCARMDSSNRTGNPFLVKTRQADRQTDVDRRTKCSSLGPERDEHLKTWPKNWYLGRLKCAYDRKQLPR
jgi:hypothetical protein